MNKLVRCIPIVLLAGCSAPEVRYDVVSKADTDGKIRFQLADTLINFDFPSQNGAKDTSSITVSATAIPDKLQTLSIEGTPWYANWGTETQLTSTHADPMLISQVGSSVKNDVVTALQTAGSISAGLIALGAAGTSSESPAAGASNDIKAPTGIKLFQFLQEVKSNTKCKSGDTPADPERAFQCTGLILTGGKVGDKAYTADLTLDAVPQDALWRTLSLKPVDQRSMPSGATAFTVPTTSRSFVYSACRNLTITVHIPAYTPPPAPVPPPIKDKDKQPALALPNGGGFPSAPAPAAGAPTGWGGKDIKASLVVADAQWVETVAFPGKGNVKINTPCGADAVPQDYTPTSPLDVLNAAVQAAKTASASTKGSGAK